MRANLESVYAVEPVANLRLYLREKVIDLNEELQEMLRITKPGGMVILCPGNDDQNNERHDFLVNNGFEWSTFEEPGVRLVRKYWKKTHLRSQL